MRLTRLTLNLTLFILLPTLIFAQARDSVYIAQGRGDQQEYCFDFTNTIPENLIREINTEAAGLKRVYDIDFVVVIIPSLGNRSVTDYTVDLFSKWQIGKSTQGKKGLLVLISKKEQQIRMEVGYDLEQVYTDQYIARIERDLLKQFLEQADWERGFLATIEHLLNRAYRMQKKGIDARDIASSGAEEFYSGGAGAENVFEFGAALKKPLPDTPKALRDYFSAQSTPALAFKRYMEFNARDMSDYTLDLFSELSKEFFSHWKTSSGQRREEADTVNGIPFIVKQKGRYAVVMFPCKGDINKMGTCPPYYFIRTKNGWQVDINTMSRSIICGGPYWNFLTEFHPYMFAFDGYLLKNRFYPLEGQKAFLGLVYLRFNSKYSGFEVVPEEGPAEQAGIEENDVLVSIDGVPITKEYQDWEMMKNHNPGDTVNVVVLRNGREKKFNIKLSGITSYKDESPWKREEGSAWLGLYPGYSEPYERDIVESYISVLDVVENSPAQKAGFKAGDLIIDIPGMKDSYASIWDYFKLLKAKKAGDKIKFKVLRNLQDKIELSAELGRYSRGMGGF